MRFSSVDTSRFYLWLFVSLLGFQAVFRICKVVLRFEYPTNDDLKDQHTLDILAWIAAITRNVAMIYCLRTVNQVTRKLSWGDIFSNAFSGHGSGTIWEMVLFCSVGYMFKVVAFSHSFGDGESTYKFLLFIQAVNYCSVIALVSVVDVSLPVGIKTICQLEQLGFFFEFMMIATMHIFYFLNVENTDLSFHEMRLASLGAILAFRTTAMKFFHHKAYSCVYFRSNALELMEAGSGQARGRGMSFRQDQFMAADPEPRAQDTLLSGGVIAA
eukprot:GFYU01000742.1.p1 GENE.GFYU01000742.1~~GFYU01000742.1.p1  ORF type:complete len:309 (-),score=9.09 GFYU01000742.1:652-1464(-)